MASLVIGFVMVCRGQTPGLCETKEDNGEEKNMNWADEKHRNNHQITNQRTKFWNFQFFIRIEFLEIVL